MTAFKKSGSNAYIWILPIKKSLRNKKKVKFYPVVVLKFYDTPCISRISVLLQVEKEIFHN